MRHRYRCASRAHNFIIFSHVRTTDCFRGLIPTLNLSTGENGIFKQKPTWWAGGWIFGGCLSHSGRQFVHSAPTCSCSHHPLPSFASSPPATLCASQACSSQSCQHTFPFKDFLKIPLDTNPPLIPQKGNDYLAHSTTFWGAIILSAQIRMNELFK